MESSAYREKMRVAVRVRPFNRREVTLMSQNIISMSDNTVTIADTESKNDRQFTFDSCHWSYDGFDINEDGVAVPSGQESRFSGQEAIFKDVGLPALEKAWEGYNIAILAYGSTGSGKSHTMLGGGAEKGIVPLCCDHLFTQMYSNPQHTYKVTFSLLEVHYERVVDLLSKSSQELKIRQKRQGVYVDDLTTVPVKSASQMEELLMQGLRNRSVAATKMNATSSRSHLVVTIHFQQLRTAADGSRIKRKSRIRFVDMAGSERASKSGTTGDRLREGISINMSISGLHSVINALANEREGKRTFVPYRDTKFTRLLMEELGGNCATTLIATISPASFNYDETLATLIFAKRARMVSQKPAVNDQDVDRTISTWKEQIVQMESGLVSAESEEQKAELEKSIETLKTSIQQLEMLWKEKDTKEKGGTWWSTSIHIQQPELETMPYLQNVSEDAQLSGVVKHVIPDGQTLVGRSDTEKVNIELSGLGIQPWHAILTNSGSTLRIAPYSRQATVHVNGRPIFVATTLNHLDHVKLGACELFVVIGFPKTRATGNPSSAKHQHERFLSELAKNHPLYDQLRPSGSVRAQTAVLLLFQEFMDFLPEVSQAQALAASFGKNIDFEVEVQPNEKQTKELVVRVIDRDLGMEWVWSKAKFESRKMTMDLLYNRVLSTGKVPQLEPKENPFYDADSLDMYLGRCTVSLHNVTYLLPVDDVVPVLDFSGRQVAMIHINMVPCSDDGEPLLASGPTLQDPQELVGKPLSLRLTMSRFSEVLWVATNHKRGVYCRVLMEGEQKALNTETVCGLVRGKFQNKFHFAFDLVTPKLLDFLQTQGLQLELWGTQTPRPSSLSAPPPSSSSSVRQPRQSTDAPASKESTVNNGALRGVMLDLTLAQDLRVFFRKVCPVQQRLRSLRKQVDENSQAQEVRLQSWADCSSQIQTVEDELKTCVLSLKEQVKNAIQRSKQS